MKYDVLQNDLIGPLFLYFNWDACQNFDDGIPFARGRNYPTAVKKRAVQLRAACRCWGCCRRVLYEEKSYDPRYNSMQCCCHLIWIPVICHFVQRPRQCICIFMFSLSHIVTHKVTTTDGSTNPFCQYEVSYTSNQEPVATTNLFPWVSFPYSNILQLQQSSI